MRSIWKGTISFGLVNIPIALGVATQRSDPKFRTLDAETKQPIRQQMVATGRDDAVVERTETLKGYEVGKGQFVVVTDEELESVAVERRRTIDIVAFIDTDEVDPVYYDRTYYVAPQEAANKPYTLLLQALKETGKAAVGKLVLSSKEHLVLLRPSGDALAIELLFYPEDVRLSTQSEIEDVVHDTKVADAELDMAKQLVESLSRPFEPNEFENEHKRDLMALIEKKLAGEEIEVAPEPEQREPVPDLMAALQASLEQAKGVKAKGGKAKGGKAKAGAAKSTRAKKAKASNGAKAKPKSRARAKTKA
ncbi:MAG TPA: Ku protein [Thermoleophilaceae bacterium]|nr:Ku protein [Thermoleophilaceae bacterium]